MADNQPACTILAGYSVPMALPPTQHPARPGISFPRPPVRFWGSKRLELPVPPWRFLDLPDEDGDVLGLLANIEGRLNDATRRLDGRRY